MRLADPCQPQRDQTQSFNCDTSTGKNREVLWKELVAKLNACELEYGELPPP